MTQQRGRHLPVVVIAAVLCPLALQAAAAGEKGEFRWVDDPEKGTADLMFGEAPVLRYMYAFDTSSPDRAQETYKVYHHVFGPGTGRIITKGPGGKYTHHRGLFVGFNKTQFDGRSLDFWHCRGGAHLRHVEFLEQAGGPERGTMTAVIHWNDPDGEPVVTETRTVSVSSVDSTSEPGYAWQIDWSTTLESNRGEIVLDGDRQHAGFQFRAHNAVAESNGARYIRPEGFPQQEAAFQVGKGDKHIDLGWFAMTYELDNRRYTIEYFDNPSLPKPSRFSERPYGRFGTFFRTTLKPDQPLTMRYRVRVSTGDPPPRDDIQQRYESFLRELKSGKE